VFFGKKLKELRLKHASKGLRNFSIATGMAPSEYSAIERGLAPPPEDKEWIHKIMKLLELPEYSEDEMDLYIEWNKPFVMQLMNEDIFICHGLMSDGTSADAKKLVEVSEYMQNIAIEHNKKAREFNGTK
jgi:transcriptional regulator with XRE-family HTH domain